MKLLFLVLSLFSYIFAVEIDKSWYDNTNENLEKLYTENLKKVEPKKNSSTGEQKEQIDYQILLLKKLLNQIKQDTQLNLKEVADTQNLDDYIKEIKDYLKTNADYIAKFTEFQENNKKLETIAEQIDKSTEKENIQTINSQLLNAYYQLKNRQVKKLIDEYEKYQNGFKAKLLQNLKNAKFVIDENSTQKVAKINENYTQLLKDEKKLSLALDKASISENESKIVALNSNIEDLKNDKAKVIENIVYAKVEELLPYLQNKRSEYFDLTKALQDFIESNDNNYNALLELLKYLSREHLGVTKTTFADTKESFLDVLKYSWDEINKPMIPIGDGVSILAVFKFILIFIIGFSIATFYRKKITNENTPYLKNTSIATRTILANLGYYFLVALTFVFGLKSVGIDLSSLTILVGALSVGIGFGLQNIVSNFISGIILIFEKSIQVGNVIEISSGIRGKVSQINMRSSVITTFDNIEIIIPNSTLMQNNVINLTFSDDVRRLHVPFGIAYGSNIDDVIKIILNSLEKSNLIYIKHMTDKLPSVKMKSMAASSVDFELLVWINENPNENGIGSSTLSDFLIFIYKTLLENNIEIPFPQMDINIKKEISC